MHYAYEFQTRTQRKQSQTAAEFASRIFKKQTLRIIQLQLQLVKSTMDR